MKLEVFIFSKSKNTRDYKEYSGKDIVGKRFISIHEPMSKPIIGNSNI